MNRLRTTLTGAAVLALAALPALPATAEPNDAASATGQTAQVPLERQTLAPQDGWAALDAGTVGGSAAAESAVYNVYSRTDLLAASQVPGTQPRIIIVHGTIDLNTDSLGNPITCDDYATQAGYSLDSYLATYDPAIWGRSRVPTGSPETERVAAQRLQAAQITVNIPSNTTIVGADPSAGLVGAQLQANGVNNIIIRNLTISNTFDCFPQWDPTDGADGNWNSQYDSIHVINRAQHIWVNHVTFTDVPMTDDTLPVYFGREYQRHDGALDITNASDLVTVSFNTFMDHDKLMLIGSSDSRTSDAGALRVSVHDNLFLNVGQRAPRVRYGQVDVYNNHYVVSNAQPHVGFVYSLGVGVASHLYAEANYFSVTGVPVSQLIGWYKGTQIHTADNVVNGKRVDLLGEYNAAAPAGQQLTDDATWSGGPRMDVLAPQAVPAHVDRQAGPIYIAG